jgi:hypothetical protein
VLALSRSLLGEVELKIIQRQQNSESFSINSSQSHEDLLVRISIDLHPYREGSIHRRTPPFLLSANNLTSLHNVCHSTCPDIWADKSENCFQMPKWPFIITQCNCVRLILI